MIVDALIVNVTPGQTPGVARKYMYIYMHGNYIGGENTWPGFWIFVAEKTCVKLGELKK